MLDFLTEEERLWAQQTYDKLQKKVAGVCVRVGNRIPYIAKAGVYEKDWGTEDIAWWTNGFWAGLLWQMYHATGEEAYGKQAAITEERLDRALEEFEGLYHDVGFMWMHSAVANYRLTQNPKSRIRGLHAANLLAGRFNPLGEYIRAWNGDMAGWMIVDCLMNLPLLYWAEEETKDPRFGAIARIHADTTIAKVLREDGSANHILILDPRTGALLDNPAGQGYASGSSWSRGQAWAVYGLALSYVHTREEKYLKAAQKVADYFCENVSATGYLPLCDFRQPKEPVIYDSTAGAIASCGMLEIAKYVPEEEKFKYEQCALRMLMAMDAHFCNWNPEEDGMLYYGRVAYEQDEKENGHVSIIYGDYFYAEAILRLMEKDFFIW